MAPIGRVLRVLGMLVLVLAGALWMVVPPLIRAVYDERLTERVSALISGRDVHPVEFYLGLAERPRAVTTVGLVLLGCGLLALSRSSWRAAARSAVTGDRPGWAGAWRPTVAVIVVAAAGLRLFDLGGTSLWLDEAYIANISASGGPRTILEEMARQSSAAPLQHLLQAFLHASGIWGAAAARLPAALAGLAAVLLLLATPRWGIPRPAAGLAGLVLAVTPIQVDFSRDATQYGLAVLMGAVLLALTLKVASHGEHATHRHHLALIAALVVTPWAAYPVIPAVPAFLLALLMVGGLGQGQGSRRLRRTLGVGSMAFLASGALVHRVVAVRQLRVRENWYLEPHYPGSSGLSWPEWTVRAIDGHLGMVAGGTWLGRVLLGVLVLGIVRLALAVWWDGGRLGADGPAPTLERVLVVAAALLLIGAVAAATLRIYPFGPIHQQLHLAPTLLLAGATVTTRLLARTSRSVRLSLAAAVVTTVAVLSASDMASAFAEKEDIVSVVRVGIDGRSERGLSVIADPTVWVYSSARPAVRFHFPDRAFFASGIDASATERMAEEATSIAVDGRVAMVFSQILPHPTQGDQRRAIQALLVGQGWMVEEEIHFTNTVVLTLVAP